MREDQPKAKLTIAEIAHLAKVTKGTVSKVLNNYPGISETTRERVREVVARVGYEPNATAQALAFRRTGGIGLVIPHTPEHSVDGAYWLSLITSITQEVIRAGYTLSLVLPRREGGLDEVFTSLVRRQQLDRLIVGAELVDNDAHSMLLSSRMPFVMLGRNPDYPHRSVDIDNEDAAYAITRHMLWRGYRRIAYVGGPIEYYYSRERLGGFRRALHEAGIEDDVHASVPYYDANELGDTLRDLFQRHSPDAVISGAGGDFMFDCLRSILDLGLSIPDVGFATFDDYRYLDFITPRVTAVQQPIQQLGSEAVRLLLKSFAGNESESRDLRVDAVPLLKTRIVVRDSCRKPARR